MMFGESLLKNKIVDDSALQEALEIQAQRFRTRPVGRILHELGHVSQDELNRQLQLFSVSQNEQSLKDLGAALKTRLENGGLSKGASAWAEEHNWLHFDESERGLTFLAPYYRDEFLEEAEKKFQVPCKILLVSSQGLTLIRYLAGIEKSDGSGQPVAGEERSSEDRVAVGNSPYVALFRDVLDWAQKEGASDIHLLPQRNYVEIRIRVNGDMETFKVLSLEHRQGFINEAKRLCGFSIATSGEAQDGRISLPGRNLDLRTSLIPSQHGEKIVMRLLDLAREFKLDRSGLPETVISDLREALRAKNGVVIVSGPTGSGKTTLLYTLLCDLDRKRKNIITLEDPIEYAIEGLTQVQVTPKLTFGQALRSVLRQDPDVILVGEIRDQETADLCLKAAATGHLVLSTLHANSAPEVVSRLLNLGVDRYMLTSCLRFSAAQRLVKKLCPKCSLEAPASVRAELAKVCLESKVRVAKDADLRVQNPAGCPACRKGLVGRTPVLEYLQAAAVRARLTASEAEAPKHVTLREAALKFAEKGEADVCEVLELE
jgi:type IV pilus assembly protein PilB